MKKNAPTIIIPCAGSSSRMRTNEPKCLSRVYKDEYLINRQIRILSAKFPHSEIYVVVGYQSEKIVKVLPKKIKIIENPLYDTTNVVKSIGLGIWASNPTSLLVVYGDLVFSEDTIDNINITNSSVLLDKEGHIDKEEIGVVINNNYIESFFFNHKTKWCQMLYLKNKDLRIFSDIATHQDNKKLFGFEALNKSIDNGAKILGYNIKNLKIHEVDYSKDIVKAVKIK